MREGELEWLLHHMASHVAGYLILAAFGIIIFSASVFVCYLLAMMLRHRWGNADLAPDEENLKERVELEKFYFRFIRRYHRTGDLSHLTLANEFRHQMEERGHLPCAE